jgi:MFS family permease
MSPTSGVQRRLTPLLLSSFLGGMALWVPIEKLFLGEIGFTPQTIGLMAAGYAAVVPILEIPSGILADRWSRRGVLLIGNAGALIGVVVGGLSTSVAAYIVAAALLGVYFAMQSGTLDAIVYDTVLEETGSSDRFESLVGRIRLAESASLVAGGLAGGGLAALVSPRFTYFATLPFLVASAVALLAFREPRLHQTGEARSLRRHVSMTWTALRSNPRLLPIAAVLVLTGILTQAMFEFGPLWLVEARASADAFGPAWAGLMAALGVGGLLAGRLRLDLPATLVIVVALMVGAAAVLVVASHPVVVTIAQVVLVLFPVTIGIHLTRQLHDEVSSDVRSGVASGVGALTWSAFVPYALGFGSTSERWGIHTSGWLVVVAVAATAGLLVVVVVAARRRVPEPVTAQPVGEAEAVPPLAA